MSDLHPRAATSRPTFEGLRQWWRNWKAARSSGAELQCFAENEVERMAQELGVSAAELRQLAKRGPNSADLLLRRMAALDLDANEVAARELAAFRDLQRVCTMCESRGRCARELARDPASPSWEEHCPNVETLKSLQALPWRARSEW